jgi:hypothetical protein
MLDVNDGQIREFENEAAAQHDKVRNLVDLQCVQHGDGRCVKLLHRIQTQNQSMSLSWNPEHKTFDPPFGFARKWGHLNGKHNANRGNREAGEIRFEWVSSQ